ncbi:MAG: hypothetical protein WAT71_00470 [Ignavibacteria bacterium]
MIIQTSILNYKIGNIKNLKSENAINILKAFLICNTNYSSKMKDLVPSLSALNQDDKELWMSIVMDVAQGKLLNSKNDIMEQSFKLREFDSFLNTDTKIGGKYYKDFINRRKITSLIDIIKITWNIFFNLMTYIYKLDYKNIKTTIIVKDNEEMAINYFDSISIINDEINFLKNKYVHNDLDFKLIRNKPLYKINNNQYIVLNKNYFSDKIFSSLIFDYYTFINNDGYQGSFADFKSYCSLNFIEKYLLKRVIEKIFEKKQVDVKNTGDNFKKKDKYNKEYSDYYLRDRKKLLLFECKDYIMKSEVKYSFDFEEIKADINKKFINKVGVDQLINTIDSISKNQIPFDKMDSHEINNLVIFPILIYTDHSYNSESINEFIRIIFKEKINQLKIKFQIEPIIMIHIDSLVNYQELFRTKVNFINVLERFNKFIISCKKRNLKSDNIKSKKLSNFDTFLKKYMHKERKFTHKDIKVFDNLYMELYQKNNFETE